MRTSQLLWLHPHNASSQLPTSSSLLHTSSSHNLHMLAPYLDISCPFIFSIPCSHLHIHHVSLKHDCWRYYLFTSFFVHMSYIYVSFRSRAIRRLVLHISNTDISVYTLYALHTNLFLFVTSCVLLVALWNSGGGAVETGNGSLAAGCFFWMQVLGVEY